MSPELHGVAVYNPDLLAKQELIRLFVARQPLLDRLVRDLRDEISGLAQHHLIVGRRGMGKTTLLRRLRFAIEDDPELDQRWLPLVFPEEQYNVASLSDFWLNCVDALADSLEARGQRESLRSIDEQINEIATTADEATRRASALKLLLSMADGIQRRLVLLIDNVDLVLGRLDQDDWALREVLSREPRLLVMGATSQALESSFRYDKAFYDFFRVHNLEGLDEAQAFEIMRHLATLTDQPHVLELIDREPGRIQTLRLLSGGNPRTLVLLFNLLSQGTEGDARSDLERLLDQITPLYKHRFEELAPQAQRVVDGLALMWDPATARDLADRLRLDVSLTSAQLNRLVKQGVVEKTRLPGSKRIGFQISERFFNIWYLMRASRRMRRRLLFLVKFIELFFPSQDLRGRGLRHLRAPESSHGADFGFALAQVAREPGLRHALETHSLRAILADPRSKLEGVLDLDGEDRELKTRAERLTALAKAERAVLNADWDWPEGLDGQRFWELLGSTLMLSAQQKFYITTQVLTATQLALMRAFLIDEQEHKWPTWFSPAVAEAIRGAIRKGYVDNDLATDDIKSAVEVCEDPAILPSLLAYKSNSGGTVDPREFDDSIHATQQHWVRVGWAARASHVGAMNRLQIVDESDPESISADSLFALGITYSKQLVAVDEAEDAFRRAIELDPNHVHSWNGLANLLQDHLGRFDEAEAAYRRAIELDPNFAHAWSGLAQLLHNYLARVDEAEAAYRRAIELEPREPKWHNNFAWFLYSSGGDLESAERSAQTAVDGAPDVPHYGHTLAYIQAARGAWPAEAAAQFLAVSDETYRREAWPAILKFFAEVVHHGHAEKARALLQTLRDAEAWAPMIAALEAAENSSPDILLALSPEMRQAAEIVLARIAPELVGTPDPR
ncbi:TPR domain protein, putative component of TonB system [Enhygromyxa salina]|uniref:TPR domain protein, putative component of TonB system n=1 Tax=Enhygromyxa salina TaxID=215803 RepID=A0A0C2D1P9_9BACT|nr:tetratricopeptide repeat protein [Enhygromyxa salina]KIG14092.1 TPR domain protein, putative component of TonB system [Enhygromyxa salina]